MYGSESSLHPANQDSEIPQHLIFFLMRQSEPPHMLGRAPSAEGQGQFTVTMQKHINFIPIFIPQSQDIPIWEYTFTYGTFTLIFVSGDKR